MRKFLSLVLVMVMLAIAGTALAADAPILFGMKWGDTPSQCQKKGMKDTTPSDDGDLYLDYKNAGRKIGDIKIDTVGYTFCHGKLSHMLAFIESESGFQTLKGALNKKYGAPENSRQMQNLYGSSIGISYTWLVGVVTIDLQFNFAKGEGGLSYNHSEYSQPCIQDTENKEKSASEDL